MKLENREVPITLPCSLGIIKVETEEKEAILTDIASLIWHEHFVSIISEQQIDYMVGMFQSKQAVTKQIEDGYEYYLFRLEDTYIGYMGIHPEEEKLFLSKLYLQKEYRGRGLARQALEFLVDYCIRHHLAAIYLTCNRNNDKSIAVYKKMGFVTVREQVADIGNGFVMDDYVMEKIVLV